MTYYATYESPLGDIYLVFSGRKLSGILFERPHMKAGAAPGRFLAELAEYFAGTLTGPFRWPLHLPHGTDFERTVWLALREVPFGETRSYKWLAQRVGRPLGSRAVGRALAKNPIPIVLPCHRIVESDGELGGYTPGVNIKRRLLMMEHYHSRQGSAEAAPDL
jgi:methylated-DNA-[protein]-cysteine S-methyltransferase